MSIIHVANVDVVVIGTIVIADAADTNFVVWKVISYARSADDVSGAFDDVGIVKDWAFVGECCFKASSA